MGVVRTPEQLARVSRDRSRLEAARQVLNWTVVGGDVSRQLAAVRELAVGAEGFGASEALTLAADLWKAGDYAGARQAIDGADESLKGLAEAVPEEVAGLLARFAASEVGTAIVATGATGNALVGVETVSYSGADDKLIADAEARADSIKFGGGMLAIAAVIFGLMYLGGK